MNTQELLREIQTNQQELALKLNGLVDRMDELEREKDYLEDEIESYHEILMNQTGDNKS